MRQERIKEIEDKLDELTPKDLENDDLMTSFYEVPILKIAELRELLKMCHLASLSWTRR